MHESRVDHDPGYGVYSGRVGDTTVLMLCGGDKTTQAKDIDRAKSYFEDFRARQG